jgi:hypothetical protein
VRGGSRLSAKRVTEPDTAVVATVLTKDFVLHSLYLLDIKNPNVAADVALLRLSPADQAKFALWQVRHPSSVLGQGKGVNRCSKPLLPSFLPCVSSCHF